MNGEGVLMGAFLYGLEDGGRRNMQKKTNHSEIDTHQPWRSIRE